MKTDLNALDLDNLQLLLRNYEKELKTITTKGYSWQETYFMSDKLSQNINDIHHAINSLAPYNNQSLAL